MTNYNDKYNADYKFKREMRRDTTSLVGEMASANEHLMNEAIETAYQNLEPHDRVIIDGMLSILQNYADERGRRGFGDGFGDMSRKELLVKVGLWMVDNPKAVKK